MKLLCRRALVTVYAAVASGTLLVLTAPPAWAPTCGAMCASYPISPNPPTSSAQCKAGGWQNHTDAEGFAFGNQGRCEGYVAAAHHAVPPSPQFPGNPG
jgi:hypothetical protein